MFQAAASHTFKIPQWCHLARSTGILAVVRARPILFKVAWRPWRPSLHATAAEHMHVCHFSSTLMKEWGLHIEGHQDADQQWPWCMVLSFMRRPSEEMNSTSSQEAPDSSFALELEASNWAGTSSEIWCICQLYSCIWYLDGVPYHRGVHLSFWWRIRSWLRLRCSVCSWIIHEFLFCFCEK